MQIELCISPGGDSAGRKYELMINVDPNHTQSAYGGDGWRPRQRALRGELGTLWAACGINSEYRPLKHVLLHRPGDELLASLDPDAVNMLEPLDLIKAQAQHDAMADAYRENGGAVTYVDPVELPRHGNVMPTSLASLGETSVPRRSREEY